MSKIDILASLHHTRQFTSSGELLDGRKRRIKATLAIIVSFSSCVLMYAAFSANVGQIDQLLKPKKWLQSPVWDTC